MTIEQTVTSTMQNAGYGQYMDYARPVITALVNREQEIVGRLLTFAEQTDLNVDAVRSALTECGMHMPTPPAPAMTTAENVQASAPNAPAEGDLAATLGRIEQALTAQNQTIQGLVGFARNNGYTG